MRIKTKSVAAAILTLAVAALVGAAEAGASGTASISGNALVYAGDATREFAEISKEPVRDDSGATVGATYTVQDTRGGGVVRGDPPCRQQGVGVSCPFGSTILQVTLGGGDDFFKSVDNTLGKGFQFGSSCEPFQSVAQVRLDGGPGRDIVDGSRLADTIAGGPGNDAISGWDGNDHVTGGPGADLLETHDGSDVAKGGSGNDVIHLDALRGPSDESCFDFSGKPQHDVGRGGPGNDAITAEAGNDRVEGGPGRDELSAGKGHDTILGGSGRDTIWSRDGQRDYVNCGSGKDLLEASDRKDRVVGCEKRFLRPR